MSRRNVIAIIVATLLVLTFVAVDAAMIVWAIEEEEFIVTMFTIATVLGTTAFNLNYIKNNLVGN